MNDLQKHNKSESQGNKRLNVLVGLTAINAVQLRTTNSTLKEIKGEIISLSEIANEQKKISTEILDVVLRQEAMQNEDRRRQAGQRALKNLVYTIDVEAKKTASLDGRLNRYLGLHCLRQSLGTTGLQPEMLDEIADKQRAHDLIEFIETSYLSAYGNLGSSHAKHLQIFLHLAKQLVELRNQAETIRTSFRLEIFEAQMVPEWSKKALWLGASGALMIFGAILNFFDVDGDPDAWPVIILGIVLCALVIPGYRRRARKNEQIVQSMIAAQDTQSQKKSQFEEVVQAWSRNVAKFTGRYPAVSDSLSRELIDGEAEESYEK